MLRSPFLWKLYVGYSLLILISCFIVGLLISGNLERDALEEIGESLRTRAALLAGPATPFLTAEPTPVFMERVKVLGRETRTRITVIRADGVVVADSNENPTSMDNHQDRPEIRESLMRGTGTATRFSDTLGMKMMYHSLAVRDTKGVVGYVRTALPLQVVDRRLGQLRGAIILGAAFSALVALCLGLVFARHFVKPLVSMTTVAEAMSRGDYHKRIPMVRKDEIGKLAKAFNRMAESSRERTETIVTDRNKLSAILASMNEGVVAINRDMRVLHLNEAAGRLLGVSPEESLGKPMWEVTRILEISELLGEVLRREEDTHRELRLATATTDQCVDMHASPLHDSQGELAGAVAVLHDVSELTRLEQVRREFVANASHELKTPITAIRGLVETLIDDADLPRDKRERFLGRIKDQSMRLSSLVTDLLALSRLESGGRLVVDRPCEVGEVVRNAAAAFRVAAEHQGILMGLVVGDEPVTILGDEEALGQAVSNLLDNALKYTPQGGLVTVSLRTEDGEAVIQVEDSGIGIEPGDQERIFERFYRVDKARSRELGGTGLGLSIVKHIAIAHGGHVEVDSVPGAGSAFRILIPLPSDAPA